MPPKNDRQEIIMGLDRLGFKIIGALARIFGSLAAKDEETYWYAITSADGNGFVDLAATIGDTDTATIEITQDADFVCTRILHSTVDPTTGVPDTDPSWTMNIRDGSSDRNLMNFQVHNDTVAGNLSRGISVPLAKNRLFRRNSTITVDLTNRQAVAARIFLVMQGYKIYDEAALDLTRRR